MLKFNISDQNLELLPDYEQRVGVLTELGFVSESGTVTLKGRVACEVRSPSSFLPSPDESSYHHTYPLPRDIHLTNARLQINSGEELTLTELILENTLAPFTPAEIVSLLSCFVFQEKTEVEPLLTPHLKEGRDVLMEISERVERVQDRWNVGSDVGAFGGGRNGEDGRIKWGLMEVVYEWANGTVRLHPPLLSSTSPTDYLFK